LVSSSTRRASHPHPHSFPTRRSSDLKLVAPAQGTGQGAGVGGVASGTANDVETTQAKTRDEKSEPMAAELEERKARVEKGALAKDRKSTRLNSSHLGISYAVFCLKKK